MNSDAIMRQVEDLSARFAACSNILAAIGDETRQHLILEMMKMGNCSGVRVGEITKKTNLSRPAVSHHLQILKAAGIVKVRKDGTKNYYSFDHETEALACLEDALQSAVEIAKMLSDVTIEEQVLEVNV